MGVALVSDLSDLSDLSDKMGAPLYTPRVCCAAVWLGSGADLPQRYAVNVMATAVCCLRGVWHNKTVTNGG